MLDVITQELSKFSFYHGWDDLGFAVLFFCLIRGAVIKSPLRRWSFWILGWVIGHGLFLTAWDYSVGGHCLGGTSHDALSGGYKNEWARSYLRAGEEVPYWCPDTFCGVPGRAMLMFPENDYPYAKASNLLNGYRNPMELNYNPRPVVFERNICGVLWFSIRSFCAPIGMGIVVVIAVVLDFMSAFF